ncbi:MAG: thioredoxin domain-containing protein [Leeuwenhoekiella sp.]
MSKEHNTLIHETSPYLLQHAYNPVAWQPWTDEVFLKAKQENKLVVVSIGYSACHWCHVMEHESFEDDPVAQVMNAEYISVKVDREERPDVDQVYMRAVQLMTGQGGWPLNVVVLPDGRPVWGGTYFKKQQWINALQQIADLYKTDPSRLIDYAEKLATGLQETAVVNTQKDKLQISPEELQAAVAKWQEQFDLRFGGTRRAPKFMMPSNYSFLLNYLQIDKNRELADFVHLTLRQMAYGGLYDQVGGGFSRYSVDEEWHVPHFEKMLYDNAQLLALYSDAYKSSGEKLYQETVYQTFDFLNRELRDESGGYYAALDADSLDENGTLQEGAFYVWKKQELQKNLGDTFYLFAEYYNVNPFGYWEHGNYVLIRQDSDANFIAEHQLEGVAFQKIKADWLEKLMTIRSQRKRPRLDNKIITGWNGLLATGLFKAYQAFGEKRFLASAESIIDLIHAEMMLETGRLKRILGKEINGFLEDYVAVIEAALVAFETTGKLHYLQLAQKLTTYVEQHYSRKDNLLFSYTSDEDTALVNRPVEVTDNVIPSSNSMMANNLFRLGKLLGDTNYIDRSARMLTAITDSFMSYPSGYSNWFDLVLATNKPFYEIVIIGSNAKDVANGFFQRHLPNCLMVFSESKNDELTLLKGRYQEGETLIYICQDQSCQLPVKTLAEAMQILEN